MNTNQKQIENLNLAENSLSASQNPSSINLEEQLQRLAHRISHQLEPHCLPDKAIIQRFITVLHNAMFPQCSSSSKLDSSPLKKTNKTTVINQLQEATELLQTILKDFFPDLSQLEQKITSFFIQLEQVFETLCQDAIAHYRNDPAANSLVEVLTTYPGFKSICYFRVANTLHKLGIPTIPRVITEYAHQLTGIDIHPAATIGPFFAIDHGTGVVIGETTQIGKNVNIYQGVTLGALSVSKELATNKRHPTIEDNVTIYANATILGGQTTIGHNSIIGGNSWVTKSVPPSSKVYRST